MYRIDRRFFHITSNPGIRRVAGLRLGRCSDIPANDIDFGMTEEEVARFWCERAGIPWLGRADIGHDAPTRSSRSARRLRNSAGRDGFSPGMMSPLPREEKTAKDPNDGS